MRLKRCWITVVLLICLLPLLSYGEIVSKKVDNRFVNDDKTAQPSSNGWKIFWRFMTEETPNDEPQGPLPVINHKKDYFAQIFNDEIRITWMGHSAMLIEMEGKRLLTDPAFSERASPIQWFGPKRFHPVPIPIDDLPILDAIIISHDHYDHLDYDSILALDPKTKHFYVPLGVKKRLVDWGIASSKVSEQDWWEGTTIDDTIELIATPAQHFSGRNLTDRNKTLWASWVIKGNKYRVYFSGDTGMFDGFKEIGKRYGPFDYTLMHIGAYSDLWLPMHMTPEEAAVAHKQLKGKIFLPIHWGTFKLAFHPWNEPAERIKVARGNPRFDFYIPKPGESIRSGGEIPQQLQWWLPVQNEAITSP